MYLFSRNDTLQATVIVAEPLLYFIYAVIAADVYATYLPWKLRTALYRQRTSYVVKDFALHSHQRACVAIVVVVT